MKNKIILILTICFGLISCDDSLDLAPQDQLTLSVTFSNKTNALGALSAVYSTCQQDDVLNGTWQLAGDWMADNIDFVGSFTTYQDVKNFAQLSDNGSIASMWDDNYEAIGMANLVIKYVPTVADLTFTDDEKNNAVAQAKFMRALLYFNMANWYAQPLSVKDGTNDAVPLVLEPFDAEVKFPARNSLNEVYTQVATDLTEALPYLDNSDNSLATKGAAYALLARLHLYKGEYADAATNANNAINETGFALATDYTFYDSTSPEHFFTLVNTAADGQDTGQGFSGLSNPTPEGRGDAPFSDNLIAAFNEEAGDLRFSSLTTTGSDAEGNNRTFSTKFPEAINNSDNAPVLRVTEMYLTRAEANFQASTSVGDTPLNDINALRSRAGLADLATVDLDAILKERRKELCFEGHRRMDLLRNNMNLRRPGMDNEDKSEPGDLKTIFPIPVNQRDINPNMTQNEGY